MNKIMLSLEPQTPIEILSNAYRTPVEHSFIYEPNLFLAIIIKPLNTPEHLNTFYDYSYNADQFPVSSSPSDVKLLDLPGDVLSVCQFHTINVSQ